MTILASIIKPLVYVSLPALALKTFADTSPIARYYVRVGLYLSTLGVCSIWGVICSIGMGLTGNRFDVFYVVARSFYFLASRMIGIRLVVEGEEYLETRPSVLVGNHQSMFDILYLGRCVTLPACRVAPTPSALTRFLPSCRIICSCHLRERVCACVHVLAIESFPAARPSWQRRNSSGPPSLANS